MVEKLKTLYLKSQYLHQFIVLNYLLSFYVIKEKKYIQEKMNLKIQR